MAGIEYLMPDHGMNGTVARERNVQREVMVQAERLGQRATARLRAHRKTGAAKIEVRHHLRGQYGDIDSDVSLVDPNAAYAIEFGHVNHRDGEWVDGIYALTGAI